LDFPGKNKFWQHSFLTYWRRWRPVAVAMAAVLLELGKNEKFCSYLGGIWRLYAD